MEIKWIKLDVTLFANRKIKQLRTLPDGDSLVVIWLQLMCLAGAVNDNGRVYFTEDMPYSEEMLATAFDEPLARVQTAMKLFRQFGMIGTSDEVICITNWEKYQASDRMADIREYNRLAQQKHRKKICQDDVNDNVNDMSMTCQRCQGTDKEIDIDKEKELYISSDIYKKKENNQKSDQKRFSKPTIAEIEQYCSEKGYEIDAEAFWNYYESKGWVVGKAPMKNWKSAVTNWAKNDRNWMRKSNKPYFSADEMEAEELDINELRRKLGLPEVES